LEGYIHRRWFRVGVGTLQNPGVGETDQEMVELERWTFANTVANEKYDVSSKVDE